MHAEHDTLSPSEVLIKIKVQPQDYQPNVEKRLHKLQHQVKLPGFRPGEPLRQHLMRLYGDSLRAEALEEVLRTTLEGYIKTAELNVLGEPVLQESEIAWDVPIDLTYIVGLKPKIALSSLAKATVVQHEIQPNKEDMKEAIEGLQRRFGDIIALEKVTKTSLVQLALQVADKEDFITLDIAQVDSPKPLLKQALNSTVSLTFAKLFKKERYPAAVQRIAQQGVELSKPCAVRVHKIDEVTPHALDEALFEKAYGKAEVMDVATFETRTKEGLTAYYTQQVAQHLTRTLKEAVIAKLSIPTPTQYLKAKLQREYPDQSAEWQADALKRYCTDSDWRMVIIEVNEEQQFKIDNNMIQQEALHRVVQQMGLVKDPTPAQQAQIGKILQELFEKKENIEALYFEILENKVLAHLLTQVRVDKKAISVATFKKQLS